MRRTCGVDVVSQWRRAYVGEGLWDMHAAAALGIGPTGGKLEPSHAALRGRSAGRQAVGLNRLGACCGKQHEDRQRPAGVIS